MADVVDPNAPAFAELDSLLEKGQYRAAGRKADDSTFAASHLEGEV